MRASRRGAALLATLLVVVGGAIAEEAPTVAEIFGHHMVLQRDRPVPVWGNAPPGLRVSVEFAGQQRTGRAGADGRWQVALDAMSASAAARDLVIRLAMVAGRRASSGTCSWGKSGSAAGSRTCSGPWGRSPTNAAAGPA